MKKIHLYYFLFLFVLLQTSCFKDRNQVRIKNTFGAGVSVVVGPVDYGVVKSVSTTEYRSVPKGNQTISGDINGNIVIPKHGKHKYTISINSVGIVTLIEDGK